METIFEEISASHFPELQIDRNAQREINVIPNEKNKTKPAERRTSSSSSSKIEVRVTSYLKRSDNWTVWGGGGGAGAAVVCPNYGDLGSGGGGMSKGTGAIRRCCEASNARQQSAVSARWMGGARTPDSFAHSGTSSPGSLAPGAPSPAPGGPAQCGPRPEAAAPGCLGNPRSPVRGPARPRGTRLPRQRRGVSPGQGAEPGAHPRGQRRVCGGSWPSWGSPAAGEQTPPRRRARGRGGRGWLCGLELHRRGVPDPTLEGVSCILQMRKLRPTRETEGRTCAEALRSCRGRTRWPSGDPSLPNLLSGSGCGGCLGRSRPQGAPVWDSFPDLDLGSCGHTAPPPGGSPLVHLVLAYSLQVPDQLPHCPLHGHAFSSASADFL